MLDFETILNRKRMLYSKGDEDGLIYGKRVNRLFGLNDLIKENLNSQSIVVDLGSHVGSSGGLFAYYCKLVFCVDVWTTIGVDYVPEFEYIFDEYMVNFPNTIKIKASSVYAASVFKNNNNYLDMVYIDADHSYEAVKEDINCWLPKIRKGGIIAGHDYFPELANTDVTKAVLEVLGKPDKTYEDSSWLMKII